MFDKKLIILSIHGMGKFKDDEEAHDFDSKLIENLKKTDLIKSNVKDIHFDRIYYQKEIQDNQEKLLKSYYTSIPDIKLDFMDLRELMMYNFSDAVNVEAHAGSEYSPYTDTQNAIYKKLKDLYSESKNKDIPIIIVADSLGCRVISNYIWDAQSPKPSKGIWKGKKNIAEDNEDNFLRLKTLKYLFTTGCNIPLFVAGLDRGEIKAIKTNSDGYSFEWYNYYDRDDVLGWPLKPISDSYFNAVTEDVEIDVTGDFLSTVLFSWNPLCHMYYWETKAFINDLAKKAEAVIESQLVGV